MTARRARTSRVRALFPAAIGCSRGTRGFFQLLLASAALAPIGRAQDAGGGADIIPIVTAAMGDRGGRLFGQTPDPRRTRHYYIAAEAEAWDYAPSGRDLVHGGSLPPAVAAAPRNDKLRYVQYTDATFRTRIFARPSLGLLGPVLRGVVGDYLAVTFLNRTGQPLSLHPHGVHYDKDNEGSYDRLGPGRGAAVGPGATFTYVWQLDEKSGPLPGEPSSKGWLYHSHVAGDDEINLGLVGFIIVTDPARARPDGTPVDVDREFGALFMIYDESGLGEEAREGAEYAELPPAARPARKTWAEIQEIVRQGARYAINGRSFGNLPGLEMNAGERVRWYLFGLGDEHDFHTANWSGLRVIEEGRPTDTVELLPATMKTADLVADNPGEWLLQSQVVADLAGGMFARLVVYPRGAPGADRASAAAFLGLPAAAQSLRVARAEAAIDSAPAAAEPCAITLAGTATVFEAFAVFNQTIQLQLGDRSVTFHPDAHGAASAPGAVLQLRNAGPLGVVYGGVLEFEFALHGAEWLAVLRQLGLPAHGVMPPELSVPFTLKIGAALHRATAALAIRSSPAR